MKTSPLRPAPRGRQIDRTMIPKVIAKERQRARRDVNNDDYDESTDSPRPVTSVRDAGISRMEPDEVVWISGGGSPHRAGRRDG